MLAGEMRKWHRGVTRTVWKLFVWDSVQYSCLVKQHRIRPEMRTNVRYIDSMRGSVIDASSFFPPSSYYSSYHSFVISKSGAVFGWGKNVFGQLGVCDTTDRWYPTLVKALRLQKVKAIACGEDHTVVLTSEGGVFTFGHGQFGQLGHNSTNHEINPKKVFELMGRRVTQIAAGRRHTIAYDQACGHILSFGLGANGQLGYVSAVKTGLGVNQMLPVTVQVGGSGYCFGFVGAAVNVLNCWWSCACVMFVVCNLFSVICHYCTVRRIEDLKIGKIECLQIFFVGQGSWGGNLTL